jgi:hypothetical protein
VGAKLPRVCVDRSVVRKNLVELFGHCRPDGPGRPQSATTIWAFCAALLHCEQIVILTLNAVPAGQIARPEQILLLQQERCSCLGEDQYRTYLTIFRRSFPTELPTARPMIACPSGF